MNLRIVVTTIHIILSLVLIAVVLLQSGKSAGLSGSIAGGAETFFGRNEGRKVEARLAKWTSIVAIAFIITSVALTLVYAQ